MFGFSSTMAEHEGKLFCKPCHTRQFGLKGYGYGGGAGTLASEAGSHQTDGGGKYISNSVGISSLASPCPLEKIEDLV